MSSVSVVHVGLILLVLVLFASTLLLYGFSSDSTRASNNTSIEYRLVNNIMNDEGVIKLVPRDSTPPLQGELSMYANEQGGSLYSFIFTHYDATETSAVQPQFVRTRLVDEPIMVDLNDAEGVALADTLCGFDCTPEDTAPIEDWINFKQSWSVEIIPEAIFYRATSSTIITDIIIPDIIKEL